MGRLDVQKEEALGERTCLANCEGRNALIPVPSRESGWWDGMGMAVSRLPGCCPVLPHRMGSLLQLTVLGWTTPKPPHAPSRASRGQLRPRLCVPVDKQIILPVQNLAAVLLVWLGMGAWSARALLELLCSYITQPDRNVSQEDFLEINGSRPHVEDFSPDWVDCADPVS